MDDRTIARSTMKRSITDSHRQYESQADQRQYSEIPKVHSVTALSLLTVNRSKADLPCLLLCDTTTQRSPLSWTRLSLGVNQLSGPAGCAKTQIALSMCLNAALHHETVYFTSANNTNRPSSSVAAVYLSLGSSRHSKIAQRLEQMAKTRLNNIKAMNSHYSSSTTNSILSRILIKAVMTPEDLLALVHPITGELGQILHQSNKNIAQVVILDDIATLFRVLEGSIVSRSATLFALAASLKRLSDKYQVPILVLNQVTTKGNDISSINEPALGLSWAQCVNQAYSVTKRSNRTRTLLLERSPTHGPNETEFTVQDCGVVMK
jgi:hypothetical protein